MIERRSDSLWLRPDDIQPSQAGWKVIGVFNPGVAIVGDELVMLARIAELPTERRPGWTALPRWSDGAAVVDWVRDQDLEFADARVVTLKASGDARLTSVSHLRVLRMSKSGGMIDSVTQPSLEAIARSATAGSSILPQTSYEEYGIEDPRITRIDDTYWITYVAVSRSGAATALMSSKDLVTFQRHGIVFPSENKDVVLFPDRINGDYVALHRPNPRSHFSPPQIWIARSPDLLHWGRHAPLLSGAGAWEVDRVGGGTPPILIDQGWLTLYHGSASSVVSGTVGRYTAGALLLDREQPGRILARSTDPIMVPMTSYETSGFVPNVVFPTAMLEINDDLQVFYGAADTCVAMTRFSKQSILDSLVPHSDISP